MLSNGPRTESDLTEDMLRRGAPTRAAAERTLHATIAVLAERLTPDEAHSVAALLPRELARELESRGAGENFDDHEFYERVARREHVPSGLAHEHVDIALLAIGHALDEAQRLRLARALPSRIGQQLFDRDLGDAPPHEPRGHAPPLTTLAHGKPGSRHPLSEAKPIAGQTHSVAANDDPHAETKLSSSKGLTQERSRESLATGHPPTPERPISDAGDE